MEFSRKNTFTISTVKKTHSTGMDQSLQKNIPSKKITFSYSLLPIYYFSRIFGLLPFTIVYDTNGDVHEARITYFDVLWFIISVCLYLLLALFSYKHIQVPEGPNVSQILVLGDCALLIAGLLYGAVIIVFDLYNRFKLIDIMKKFTTFDMEVGQIYFQMIFAD